MTKFSTITNRQVRDAMIQMLKNNLVRERDELNDAIIESVEAFVDVVVRVNEDHDYDRNTIDGASLRQIELIEPLAKMISPQYVALHGSVEYADLMIHEDIIVRENGDDLLPQYTFSKKLRLAHDLSSTMKRLVEGCEHAKEHTIKEMRECMDYADKRNEYQFATDKGDMYSQSTKYNFAGIPVIVMIHPVPPTFLNSNIAIQLFKYIDSMPDMCERGEPDDKRENNKPPRPDKKSNNGGKGNKTTPDKKAQDKGQTDKK